MVVLDQLRKYPSKIPALVGLVCGVGFLLVLGPDAFLIPALSVALITLVLLRDVVGPRMEARHE